MRAHATLFLALLGATACDGGKILENPAGPPEVPLPWTPPPGAPDPVDVIVDPMGHVELYPPPPVPEEAFRSRRRVDVDQLDRALRAATGGLGWTEMRGNTEVNLLVELGPTLGKPDYIASTDENLEPSAMFQKFLDDAARSVCTNLIAADPFRPIEERTFFVAAEVETSARADAAAVEANLRQLLLRFHGRKLEVGAPELEPWLWLVRSAEHVTPDQSQVWRLVCVGLITHPDFYTY